ncbi:hypothetical protein ABFO64_09370 [Acinetobacter radioresistens]
MAGNLVSNNQKIYKITPNELAQALLLEQVKFLKQHYIYSKDHPALKILIQQLYHYSEKVQLKQVINVSQLHAVVQRYAFEMNLGAEILELIGIMSQKLHQYALQSDTELQDLISDQQYQFWLTKLVELTNVRLYLRDLLLQSQQVDEVCLQMATHIIESKTPWLNQLRYSKYKVPGIQQQVLQFMQEQQQTIEAKLEFRLANIIKEQLSELLLLPSEDLYDIAMHAWQEFKYKSLQDSMSQFTAIDIEEFFVLLYESWRELRESSYLQQLILEGVNIFYQYFQEHSLKELLNAVGLTQDDLMNEGLRFIPSVLQALDQNDILDPLLHQLLSPFYAAPHTIELIRQYQVNQ